MQTETSDLLADQGSLRVLPDLTGGRAVANTNGPEHKVPEIVGETGAYYLVGFEPGTPDHVDSKRSIEVKVAREGVRVYTQRQYIAPGEMNVSSVVRRGAGPPRALEQALRGLLPNASRPLTLSVAAFAGTGKVNETIMVNVDVGAFANARGTAIPLEFAVAAVDRKTGRQVAVARETATVTFTAATSSRAVEANVQTHIEVRPGDYEVRVAVSDPATGIAASVFGPVAVPLFGSAPLSLSDVIVETTSPAAAPPEPPVPVPTTRRVFQQHESVHTLVQLCQGTQRSDVLVPVSVRTTILDAKGRAVRDQLLALTPKDFAQRRAALALDIGQLPPGGYVLTIDASMERHKASRTLNFAVQ